MRFSILTLFPEYFDSPLECSLLGRARKSDLIHVDFVNLRDHGEGKYRAVDDKPYGGGAGMVMMPTVLERALGSLLGGEQALERLEQSIKATPDADFPHVVFLSPQGKKLDSAKAREFAGRKHVVLICGHYEGVDERAIEAFVHEEVSIGDFVLTGGEPAALVLIDAVSRFIPGVVGEAASVAGDTFESSSEMAPGGLKYPMFTRPPVWRGRAIPEILTSGHHGEIAKWRKIQSTERTAVRRPDLVAPSADKPREKPKKKK